MFTDRFVSRCLVATAAMNVVAGLAAISAPALHADLMFADGVELQGVLLRFHVMLWLFVIALGLGYALAARDPSGQRPLLIAGGLGKLAAAAVWLELLVSGIGAPLMAAGVAWDGVLGAIFLAHAWRGPRVGAGGPPQDQPTAPSVR
jgi:hypothetical protein